jgi:hypothetical protein
LPNPQGGEIDPQQRGQELQRPRQPHGEHQPQRRRAPHEQQEARNADGPVGQRTGRRERQGLPVSKPRIHQLDAIEMQRYLGPEQTGRQIVGAFVGEIFDRPGQQRQHEERGKRLPRA